MYKTTAANPSRKTGFRPRAASSCTWVHSSAALRVRTVFRAPWPPHGPGRELLLLDKPHDLLPRGGTAFGVLTAVRFLENL